MTMPVHPVTKRYLAFKDKQNQISLTRGQYKPYVQGALLLTFVLLPRLTTMPYLGALPVVPLLFMLPMRSRYQQWRKRMERAVPTTAVLVQANHLLFKPGNVHAPCLVLHSPETEDSAYLGELASRIYELKEKPQSDADLSAVSEMVTDERAVRYRRRKLPLSFTGGPTVYCSDLYVYQGYLRDGCLRGRVLLCLFEPGETGYLELIPWQVLS